MFPCAFYPGWRTSEKRDKRADVLTLGYRHVTPTEFEFGSLRTRVAERCASLARADRDGLGEWHGWCV